MTNSIGRPVLRAEDERLLTGAGCFSDDVNRPGQAHAYVVRSPHAHARINGIGTGSAAAGVLAVLTAADYAGDGLGPIKHVAVPLDAIDSKIPAFTGRNGFEIFDEPQPVLASDMVRHGGEPVALVIAETLAQARDGAELVDVDYEPLAAVPHARIALEPGAPLVWNAAPGNLCLDSELGDKVATDAAFAAARHVVEVSVVNNRIVNCQMEPRSAVAWLEGDGSHTLHAGGQGVRRHAAMLADMFGLPPGGVRVLTQDVGGGFGPRNWLYPEFVMVLWAARRLGRPVKWTSDRADAFVSDIQARDMITEGALALNGDGNFLALRVQLTGNVGAHTVSFVPMANGARLVSTVYDIPTAHVLVRGVVTNTLPTGPYRGAGRPEVQLMMERLIERAAAALGMDGVELRRRNLVAQNKMPWVNPLGLTYDSGAFEANMDHALALADRDGFAARRQASEAAGKLRGLGLSNYVESPVGYPRERAVVEVKDGTVQVIVGTQSSGQGHETSFVQVISDQLGVPMELVRLITGDSHVLTEGGGTHSDRSMRLAGTAMVFGCEAVIQRGLAIAAHLLEAAVADVEFANGSYRVTGTDRSLGIFEVAAAATGTHIPESLRGPLTETGDVPDRLPAYPTGSAVCEVEIDPETGAIKLDRYTTVDDVGRVINPMIVHGQVHGGIAQGVGQVLMEDGAYHAETGQMLGGSFMDYAMPRADDLPSFTVEAAEVLCANNPLGVKGSGEAGTTPALAVVNNAILDALAPLGVSEIAMPATAERVWRAIHDAGGT